MIRVKTFFVKLKTYILLHLVDVYMLRSDYDEAEKVGLNLNVFESGFNTTS